MKPKNKITTIIILVITFILAGVAIFTAVRLYQLRSQPVAPNVPSSKPRAQEVPAPNTCTLAFTLTTATPTATPTSTPVPQCNSTCTTSSDCPSNLTCYKASETSAGYCRNSQCTLDTDCICATATPTATPTKTGTPTATPTVTSTPNSCGGSCTSNSNCSNSMICYQGTCRNPSCTSEADCVCNGTPAPTASQPSLPNSGTEWPSIFGMGLGILVILGSLLLAL